jgi:hypothetical protein
MLSLSCSQIPVFLTTVRSALMASAVERSLCCIVPATIACGAADVFAFGVVLWELLTWQEPWEEEGWSSFQIMVSNMQQSISRWDAE